MKIYVQGRVGMSKVIYLLYILLGMQPLKYDTAHSWLLLNDEQLWIYIHPAQEEKKSKTFTEEPKRLAKKYVKHRINLPTQVRPSPS